MAKAQFWSLLRAMYGGEGGRDCRVCSDAVHPADEFGMSEGVCRSCRGQSGPTAGTAQ